MTECQPQHILHRESTVSATEAMSVRIMTQFRSAAPGARYAFAHAFSDSTSCAGAGAVAAGAAPPSYYCLVNVRARARHQVARIVVRPEPRRLRVLAESELQHGHPRKSELLAE